ncbi:MAG: D-alanyl-D-alanine carboxypeptidase family protein [Bacilli bacterium]|nr:D-alanyl-D-alanine carboxypeptidase family protein [Bacilli bacterium]
MLNKRKKKNNNGLLSIFVILIYIPIIVSIFVIIAMNKDLRYKEEINIEVGEKLPLLKDYLDTEDLNRVNKNITWEKDLKVDKDNKVYHSGTYDGYITFRGEKIKFKLNVIDEEAPTITGTKDIEIFINDEIDLLKDIKTTDNSLNKVKLNIEGEYSLEKEGIYNLKYVATDAAGNTASKDFTLTVKTKNAPKVAEIDTTSKGYKITKENDIYYINGVLIANKTYSLPSSYAPGGLLDIFTSNFNKMHDDALKEGINLEIISGYRSYADQAYIYNNYVLSDSKSNADTYSARAGHSEHQTGLAADINSLNTNFIYTKEGMWLNNNCHKYGFIIRYPEGKASVTGYMYEPWHIRYVGTPLASELYNNGNWISLEEYYGITSTYNY